MMLYETERWGGRDEEINIHPGGVDPRVIYKLLQYWWFGNSLSMFFGSRSIVLWFFKCVYSFVDMISLTYFLMCISHFVLWFNMTWFVCHIDEWWLFIPVITNSCPVPHSQSFIIVTSRSCHSNILLVFNYSYLGDPNCYYVFSNIGNCIWHRWHHRC